MCLSRRSILRRGGVNLKGGRMAEHVKDCHGETKKVIQRINAAIKPLAVMPVLIQ